METQNLVNFQKDMEPLVERIKNIQRLIDSLNQALSREGVNIGVVQQELKTRFLQGVAALKSEYKATLPPGMTIDGRWIVYQNIIRRAAMDFNIQLSPNEFERLLNP